VIKKLINRLLGKTSAEPQAPAEPGATAARKTRAPKAPKVAKARTKASAGGVPRQARVWSVDEHGIDPKLLSRNAVKVTSTLQEAGYSAFIVGGAVRDLLLGIKPKDFDVATNATPDQVQALFRRSRIIGRRFQIVHVTFYGGRDQEIIEVSTFRALVDAVDAEQVPAGKRVKRTELDHHTHAVDASGRVLRDNVWGTQAEDATRRDFTVNAMYYNPADETVHDYHHGMEDMRARTLRMIGDPLTRYREDPVRMLRVVRFAAKTGFDIDPDTRAPIAELGPLIHNVPAARLFDEMLKLLMSGHAWASLQELRKAGLHRGLLPLLDVALEQPMGQRFVQLALDNTDDRVKAGKPVSPGFLFASLLWHHVVEHWNRRRAAGEPLIPALHTAMDEVLDRQTEQLAIQRRFTSDMKEIWSMQPRFEKRSGRMPYRLLESPRFRAGYDFLVLRCASGELPQELADWWTDFQSGDGEAREALMAQAKHAPSPSANTGSASPGKRRRRRRGPAKSDTVVDVNPGSSEET